MAAINFGDLKTAAGMQQLNNHLEKNSYITGYSPTQDDMNIIDELISVSPQGYPCVKRWLKHILHFSCNECKSWPRGQGIGKLAGASAAQKEAVKKTDEDDSDFDPFAEETEEDKVTKESMKQKAQDTKPKKVIINRSTLVIEVKPSNLEVNLDEVEKLIRKLEIQGLEWSQAAKKLPIAYGLFKLQIGCNIIDDKVNTDSVIDLVETIGLSDEDAAKKIGIRDGAIEEDDDDEESLGLVQSAEIVSFNKL